MGTCKKTLPDEPTSMDSSANRTMDGPSSGELGAGAGRDQTPQAPPTLPSEEDEAVPWKFVPPEVTAGLVRKLNPEVAVRGNNWRAVAGALGYNNEEIRFFESMPGVPAKSFLDSYQLQPEASLNRFVSALKQVKRVDCVKLLTEAYPEIHQKFKANSPSMMAMAEANSMMNGHSFMWPGTPTMIVPAIFQSGSASMAPAQPPGSLCCVAVQMPMAYNPSGCSLPQPAQNYPALMAAGGASSHFNPAFGSQGAPGGPGTTAYCAGPGSTGLPSAGCGAVQQQPQMMPCVRHPQMNRDAADFGYMPMDTSLPQNISTMDNSNMSSSFSSMNSNYSNSSNTCNNCSSSPNNGVGMVGDNYCSSHCGGDMRQASRQKVARQYSDESKPGQQQHCHPDDKRHKYSASNHSSGQSPCQHYSREACPGQGTPPVAMQGTHNSGMWSPSPASHSAPFQAPSSFMPQAGACQNSHPGVAGPCQNSHSGVASAAAGICGRREVSNGPQKLFIPSSPPGFMKTLDSSASTGSSFSPSPSPSVVGGSNRCRCKSARQGSSGSSCGRYTDSPCNNRHVDAHAGFFPPAGQHLRGNNQTSSQRQAATAFPVKQDTAGSRPQDGLDHRQFVAGHAQDLGDGGGGGMYQTRGRPAAPQEHGTSLAHLKKIAAIPDKYKPTNEYQTVVAEQKIEAERSKKANKTSSSKHTSGNHSGTNGSAGPSSLCSTSSGGSSSNSTVCSASQTFPLRVKVRHDRDGRGTLGAAGGAGGGGMGGVEEMGALTISKKSTSMPQDMKPQPYKRGWRRIKVFVTYSMDNQGHSDEVLSLGYFLSDNGFNCYLDSPISSGMNSQEWVKHLEKLQHKFYESDFVLVCISPKYLRDVSSLAAMAQEPQEGRLHTLDIYQMMNRDYLNRQAFGTGPDPSAEGQASGFSSGSSSATLGASGGSHSSSEMAHSPQVVPVLFGEMTADHMPGWMREVGVPCKRWKADYADLAWLLTRPQDRIRSRRRQAAENSDAGV